MAHHDGSEICYVCPMHPEVMEKQRGSCPHCHMALEKTSIEDAHGHGDHDGHAGHNPNMFRQKFWLSLALTLPVLYFSQTIQELLSYTSPQFAGSEYIPAVLGIIIFFYGGVVFLRSGRAEVANRQPGMMTLISLAITVAFSYSLLITLGVLGGKDFWWELASLVTIMLLGHWLEMASIQSAQGALKELTKLLPDEAEVFTTKGTHIVAISELKVGDKVLIRPGASVPTDGVVAKGKSKVDESMLTGESIPVHKRVGSAVIGGTINGAGSLIVQVNKTGEDTALSGIMKMVSEAQSTKSKTQLLADKAAAYLFYYALASAAITGASWVLLSDEPAGYVLERLVAALIIACPHALGLAIPLVTAISTAKGASANLLMRRRSALESARNIDVVLFDKTGTLTQGKQGVVGMIADDNNRLLKIAAAIESDSEHPIAQAIVDEANKSNVNIPSATGFRAVEGVGATAKVSGKSYCIGGPQMLAQQKITLDKTFSTARDTAHANGHSIVYLIQAKQIIGCFMITDAIREESAQALEDLRSSGISVAMITGDSEGTAHWVASELGIDEYYAEVLPGEKSKIVQSIQRDGSKVAMVGDGINDAPALTQADIGIAIGAGTDVAIESADIVLASSDPRGVNKIVRLSQKTYTKMVQNLVWATGYNLIAVPLAGGALAFSGFVLSPAVGAALMSLSTIVVTINAQLLRRVTL